MPGKGSENYLSVGTASAITVGVIIPTYNRLQLLKDAVSSVLNQTYQKINIIVMDDGSSDGTSEFLSDIQDKRLRYVINDSNLRLAGNITKGVELLTPGTDWCMVVCDDDYLDSNFVEIMVGTIAETCAKTIVHSKIVYVEGLQLRDGLSAPPEESATSFVNGRARFSRDRYLTGIMFSVAAFKEIGGYPHFTTGMAADDALVFALALKDRLVYEDAAVAFIRMHPDAESQQVAGLERHLAAINEYRQYCIGASRQGSGIDAAPVIDRHVMALSTHLWTRNVRSLLKARERRQLRDLYRLGLDKTFRFSWRVRVSAALGYFMGLCPERIGIYRLFWNRFSTVRVP